MNKSYRTIYNEAIGTWVAVSEVEKAKGKKNTSKTAALLLASFAVFGFSSNVLGQTISVPVSGQSNTASYCAIGNNTTEGGYVICGAGASASNSQGTAYGSGANASGNQSIAVGGDTVASGNSSISIGGDDLNKVAYSGTYPNTFSYADGAAVNNPTYNNTTAATAYKTLTGEYLVDYTSAATRYVKTTSSGAASVAIGVQSVAAGDLSVAFGTKAKSYGLASVAIGVGSSTGSASTSADGAIAIGAAAHANTPAL